MAFSEVLKTRIRRKTHFSCCICKSIGVEVHHIVPKEENGPDSEENAAPLCPSCHELYGANPSKRKFIREARDMWYEICSDRFSSESGQLKEIRNLLNNAVSFSEFQKFKDELFSHLASRSVTARTEKEITQAVNEFLDKVWYGRHGLLKQAVKSGKTKVDSEIWNGALEAARRIEKEYGKSSLGPWDEFDWGMLNGKLSALRWVMGDDWDSLDT
jgi:hypothetical protein